MDGPMPPPMPPRRLRPAGAWGRGGGVSGLRVLELKTKAFMF